MGVSEQLLILLGNQREVLLRLHELCRQERESLLNSAVDRLEAIIQEQSKLLATQSRLSARIAYALQRLAAEQRLTGAPTLSQVAAALPAPDGDTLRAHSHALAELADTVQQEGRVNWYLSQQAMKYMDFTLKLIGRSKEGPQPYVPTAHLRDTRPMQLLLDNRA